MTDSDNKCSIGRSISYASYALGLLNPIDDSSVTREGITDVMRKHYEDNFGFYSVGNDPDELAFLCYMRLTSVSKVCVRCGQNVHLQPDRKICEACSEALEYGAPPSLDRY